MSVGHTPAPNAIGQQKLVGHLAMILFALLIAASFSIGSRAAPHIESAAMNALRFFCGAVLMAVVAQVALRNSGRTALTIPNDPWRFLVLGALMGVYFVTMFIALQTTSPVSTGAMFTLIPFMSTVFGYLFLRQTVNSTVIISLLLAGAGSIWVIFRGDLDAILAFNLGPGERLFFFGCIGHAAYAPLVRRLNRGEPVVAFTFWTLSATCLCISLYGIPAILETDWLNLPNIVWIAIAYLAIFTTAGTFFLLQLGSMRLPASKVLAYGYLTPVFIICMEGIAGSGWVSLSVTIGALVTVGGLIVLAFSSDGKTG